MFDLTYTPTIMSGAVLRWKLDGDFQISASRDGVCIHGSLGPIDSIDLMNCVKETITKAEQAVISLNKNLKPHEWAKKFAGEQAA